MTQESNFLYQPRNFKDIKLWRAVSEAEWSNPDWQKRNAIRAVEQLKRVIRLNKHQEAEINRTIETMRSEGKDPLRITPYYASLMQADPFNPVIFTEKSNKRLDPIFWQCVPTPANLLFPNAGKEEAMNESLRSFGAAYQRYPNRLALLVAENTSCASYCVHCQRAKSLDGTVEVNRLKIDQGLFYIGYNKNINEVLVTGGDALMISLSRLQYILEELSRIPHLRVIRIATRAPVTLPMAITDEVLELIRVSANKYTTGPEKYIYLMTHINHFHEITPDLAKAIKTINQHGFTVRNQTVLLNHVNDNYRVLAETFRRMLWVGVHPYYLLQCHKERGIVHFITPIQVGKIYIKHLQGWISGITLPHYAANIEGGGGKVLLMPSGHDTLNIGVDIDAKIAESVATVSTWDHRKIFLYEALGRATRPEYEEAVTIMEKFIGRESVFRPRVIIIDKHGNHLETTNRTKLPVFERSKKSRLLGYAMQFHDMPLTNPLDIAEKLDREFKKSKFAATQSQAE